MPVQGLAGPALAVLLVDREQVVHELELSAPPPPAWRAAVTVAAVALVGLGGRSATLRLTHSGTSTGASGPRALTENS